MMTSSNGNTFRVTGPLCGEFTGTGEFPTRRPVTRSFDVFFDLRLKKRLSKQPWGWWFETPAWSLWRQCNFLFWGILIFNTWSCSLTMIVYCMLAQHVLSIKSTELQEMRITDIRWRHELVETTVYGKLFRCFKLFKHLIIQFNGFISNCCRWLQTQWHSWDAPNRNRWYLPLGPIRSGDNA